VKSIDHRPASNAFEVRCLGVLENVEQTGTGAEHNEGDNELREIRGQPRGNQGRIKNHSQGADPRPASATEHGTRDTGAHYRPGGAHEQRESDLTVAQMKVVFERRQPRNPTAAHDSEG
jgi:hypothetical protein